MAGPKISPPRTRTGSDGLYWPLTLAEARDLQAALSRKVNLSRLRRTVRLIAGADASFSEGHTIGVVSVYDLKELELIEVSHNIIPTRFPYVPGYLSFREGPAVVGAFQGLVNRPDVLMCDGQGIAHPRGLGLASHIGVLLGIPTIGCAKSRLVGEYIEPPSMRSAWTPLLLDKRRVGAVLRTRTGVKPLFVSPGHRITLRESVGIVLACTAGYRMPEPLRAADHVSRKIRREVTGLNTVQ